MSLYPSLEDMKVDQMIKAQLQAESQYVTSTTSAPYPTVPIPSAPSLSPSEINIIPNIPLYPQLNNYMSLEFTENTLAMNMPEYAVSTLPSMEVANTASEPVNNIVAPLSGNSVGLQRAQVTHSIREVILCKDGHGKIGLKVRTFDTGVYICLITKGSPASLAGVKFGDQILSINNELVAGYNADQVHNIFKNAGVNDIKVVIKDRPYERTITLHKDSLGHVGFHFKEGKIIAIVKDSSAARNGLVIDHQILEVNGVNVVGLKDKELSKEIENGGDIITVTIMPSFIYDRLIKNVAPSLLKLSMDHSVANI